MSIRTLVVVVWVGVVLVSAGCGSPPASTDDAGTDTPCTSHADCDDELFCTGDELCMPNHADALANGCLLGAPPCSAASCDEAADTCESGCADEDNDGHPDAACGGDDCDDDDDQRFPGNPEVCDLAAHDEDCDPCTVGLLDADQDLFISAACANEASEAPSPACGIAVVYSATAGSVRGLDCNDATGMIKPGQAETCNAVDDDCDGDTDENLTLVPYWPDMDMDLAGDESATPTQACARPEGFASSAGDCDDSKSEVRPFGTELCDELDNDCDDLTDEQSASYTFYRDMDTDGVGNSAMPTTATTCDPPTGFTALPGDCNDNAPLIYPGATELCDRIDNNCSQVVSPGGVATDEDPDGDGHSPVDATCSSTPVGTFAADDCDETRVTTHGGAVEFCSGLDEDCDGQTDEAGADVCAQGDTCDGGCLARQDIAVGRSEACAVLGDGGLACWGDTGTGTPVRIAGLADVEQVTSGIEHTCARLADRTVRCWGINTYGQLGAGHAMPVSGLVTPLGLGEVLSVGAGFRQTCALKPSGDVWCWGANDNGDLGLGDVVQRNAPTRVPGVDGVVELGVRSDGACTRRGDGRILCWGYEPVGDGTSATSLVPVLLSGGGVLELAAGAATRSMCARYVSGWSCWGRGNSVGTGMSGSLLVPTPVALPAGIDQLVMGYGIGCALTDGAVSCWGESYDANFGESVSYAAPLAASAAASVPLTLTPTAIDCSDDICCGVQNQQATCWGSPEGAHHGDGLRDGSSPNIPLGLVNPTQIEVGLGTACALDDGGLRCWGSRNTGHGDTRTRYLPQTVAVDDVVDVSLGAARVCTLDSDGDVLCWGKGPAGDAAETWGSAVPLLVVSSAMGDVTQLATGGDDQMADFTCALDTVGAAWCWGDGDWGTCGNGTDACLTPVPVSGGLTFTSIQARRARVCGVTTDQHLYCWGATISGQLGNGSSAFSYANLPQRVLGIGGVGFLEDVVQVAAADSTTCARLADGRVVCFGYGLSGTLGNGSTVAAATAPVVVTGLTDAQSIACGGYSCLAQRPDDTWVGWGANYLGQLGIAASEDPLLTPAPAAFGLALTSVSLSEGTACGIGTDGVGRCWGGPAFNQEGSNLRALSITNVFSLPPL